MTKLFERKGAVVFDADALVHKYYRDKKSTVYKKVVANFPQALEGARISRKKLGNVVFSNDLKLHKLEKIVHPVIIAELKKWASSWKKKNKIAVAEVPLLFEKRLASHFDGVILVYTSNELLKKRIIKKYGFSPSQSSRRLSLYLPIKEKIKRADFVINNNEGLAAFKRKANLLWKELLAFKTNKHKGC